MLNRDKKILSNRLIQNITKLISGTIIAQIITLAAIPLLTNVYSGEAFGQLALFTAIVGFISSFATLKYDTALILPKKDRDAYALLKLSNILTILITTICVIVLLLPVSIFRNYNDLAILIGLGVLFNINYNNSALWNNRFNCFSFTAKSKIIQALFICLFQFILYGFFALKGLIIGALIGTAISGIYLIYTRKSNWKIYNEITLAEMKIQGKRYVDFPKYFTLSNAILSFSAHLPIFLFAKYIPLAQIGLYGIALRIIGQPVSLIANSMRSVILSEMAKRKRENKNILKWYLNLLGIILAIALCSSLCLFILIDFIVDILLGNKWIDVALYSKCMIPMLIGMMISSPGVAAVRVLELQKYNFKYSVISLFTKLVVLLYLFNFVHLEFEKIILVYSFITLSIIVVNEIVIIRKMVQYEDSLLQN